MSIVVRRRRQSRSGLFHTIKRNPIPAAMIGIGLGWFFMSDSDHSDSENFDSEHVRSYSSATEQTGRRKGGLEQVRHQASEVVHTAESKATEIASKMQEKAEDVVDTVQSKAEDMVDQVRGQAEQVRGQADQVRSQADTIRYKTRDRTRNTSDNLMHMIEDNPLTAGAVALAAGALIGFSLPITHQEEEWMGPTRDRVVDRAQQQVADTVEQVKNKTAEVGKEVQEAFQETSEGKAGTERSKTEGTNEQEENRGSSFETQAATFRQHHGTTYGSTGRPYTDYEPAYRYGHELAASDQDSGSSWTDIKSEAQRKWNQRNAGAWVDMEGAIRYAWEQARQRNRQYGTGTSGTER